MNSPKIPDALFETRHIGSKEKDIRSMMNVLGFTSLNYLTNTIIPENIRYDSLLSLPRPLSETDTIKRLKKLRQIVNGPRDEAFIVYRTCADPRFLDLTLDPNDRELGMVWGDPYRINYGTHDVARFTTLTSWMSQWSLKSNAHGPKCIARTSVPVINLEFTADTNATPSDNKGKF